MNLDITLAGILGVIGMGLGVTNLLRTRQQGQERRIRALEDFQLRMSHYETLRQEMPKRLIDLEHKLAAAQEDIKRLEEGPC